MPMAPMDQAQMPAPAPGPPQPAGGDFFGMMVKRRMGARRPPQAGTGARPRPDGGPVFGGAGGGTRPAPVEPVKPQAGGMPGGMPPPPIFQAPGGPPPAGGPAGAPPPVLQAPGGAGMPPPPIFQAPAPQATGSSADVNLGPGFDAARAQRLKTAAQRYGPGGNPSLRGGF